MWVIEFCDVGLFWCLFALFLIYICVFFLFLHYSFSMLSLVLSYMCLV